VRVVVVLKWGSPALVREVSESGLLALLHSLACHAHVLLLLCLTSHNTHHTPQAFSPTALTPHHKPFTMPRRIGEEADPSASSKTS